MAPLARPVRVSTKGQIVIPQEVRRRLGIKPGDRVVVVAGDSEAVLMTAARYTESVRGVAGGIYGKNREEIDAYVRGERRTWPA
ncbi:MAG: AbrB/MazE/SpoVT family DNA-binding domain-containing protein [Armatimonadota bacterium]